MKHRNSQAGNMTLFVLLALAALVVVGGAYYALRSGDGPEAPKVDPKMVFEELKARVTKVMEQPALISMNVQKNPNAFECLSSVAGNCQGKGGLFMMYEDAKPQASALSQMLKGTGLNLESMGCENFPSAGCPLRLETNWAPVCGGNYCEKTRSFRLHATLTLQAKEEDQPERWDLEKMFTPDLKLSKAVICERDGGVWALTSCLSATEAQSRRLANSGQPMVPAAPNSNPSVDTQAQAAVNPADLVCPDHIPIQGQVYTLERMAAMPDQEGGAQVYSGPAGGQAPRGQVRTAAMSGCPGEDLFTFQCQAKYPAQFLGEGQWIQIEAQMAPPCNPEERVNAGTGAGSDGEGGYARQ